MAFCLLIWKLGTFFTIWTLARYFFAISTVSSDELPSTITISSAKSLTDSKHAGKFFSSLYVANTTDKLILFIVFVSEQLFLLARAVLLLSYHHSFAPKAILSVNQEIVYLAQE